MLPKEFRDLLIVVVSHQKEQHQIERDMDDGSCHLLWT
jgi:hypothetical protein